MRATAQQPNNVDRNLKLQERLLSAAGAAFISAILVNPLDVAKTRLQAQAAGAQYSHPLTDITTRMTYSGPTAMFADLRCSTSCSRAGVHGFFSICPPDCFHYKSTFDVFCKIIRQEGIGRLWRGTNASLALAVPTVGIYLPLYDLFRISLKEISSQNAPVATPYVPFVAGSLARSIACATCYPIELARTRMQAEVNSQRPGVWKTLVEALSHFRSSSDIQGIKGYRALWTGMGAQLARDVPFSAICWSTLEPARRGFLESTGKDANAATVFGANFLGGFVAGSVAAGVTCPLDVAKTRRQIEKDPLRARRMTTWKTLVEAFREGGVRSLFTGVGPRVARAGPSVGIVVSFYEVVKHVLEHRHSG